MPKCCCFCIKIVNGRCPGLLCMLILLLGLGGAQLQANLSGAHVTPVDTRDRIYFLNHSGNYPWCSYYTFPH